MRLTLTQRRGVAIALVAMATLHVAIVAEAQTQSAVPEDPLSRRGWQLELTPHGAIETWNYNGNHEDMLGLFAGITYGIREGLALKVASPLYYVWQRDTDGYLFGLTWGVRGRLVKKRRWSGFWEFEVGVSESDTFVPPRGTRFNYLAIGGGGVLVRVRPGVHALGGLRWVHVSNNSLAGRSRNPDIEAIGPTVGLLFGF
jgi:hypothetical protein